MTRLLQLTAQGLKGVARTRAGSSVVNAARTAAGLCFDTFHAEYRTEGMAFAIPMEQTTRRMRGKFFVDTYELPERTLAKRHLPRGSRVLELGGCIGVLSCLVNRLLDNPANHVVVEANPALIPTLQRNAEANGAVFTIENCVVSRKPYERLLVHENMDTSYLDGEGIPITGRTLAAIEAAHGIEFDAVVMDIEGAEAAFIEDHPDALRRMAFLMIEFHPEALGENRVDRLRALLRDAGLRKADEMLTTEVYVRDHLGR